VPLAASAGFAVGAPAAFAAKLGGDSAFGATGKLSAGDTADDVFEAVTPAAGGVAGALGAGELMLASSRTSTGGGVCCVGGERGAETSGSAAVAGVLGVSDALLWAGTGDGVVCALGEGRVASISLRFAVQ
jgi:hypothetical protein